jgi:hypothetical protein
MQCELAPRARVGIMQNLCGDSDYYNRNWLQAGSPREPYLIYMCFMPRMCRQRQSSDQTAPFPALRPRAAKFAAHVIKDTLVLAAAGGCVFDCHCPGQKSPALPQLLR